VEQAGPPPAIPVVEAGWALGPPTSATGSLVERPAPQPPSTSDTTSSHLMAQVCYLYWPGLTERYRCGREPANYQRTERRLIRRS